MTCDNIYGLIFTITEPNAHSFAGIGVHKREATVLEVIQICVKEQNTTQEIYETELQVSQKRGKEYSGTLSSYVESARAMLTNESIAGLVNLDFGEHKDAVVDELWTVFSPINNSLMRKMEQLLTIFGVKATDRSPFLRYFKSPSDLLAVYLSLVPCDIEGGTADDDADDKEEEQDDSEDPAAAELTSENENLDCLAEAIEFLQDDSDSGPEYYTTAVEEGVTMEDSSDPEDTIDDCSAILRG